MHKLLQDLSIGDEIYLYGFKLLGDRDVFIKKKLNITKVSKNFGTATGYCNGVRYIIKSNERSVYRNMVWIFEEDDKLAKELLINFYNRKIEILEHDIENCKDKINRIKL